MEVYGYDPFISVNSAWRLNKEIHHAESPDELFENCDYFTVHVPATDSSRDLLNKVSFAKMKDGVRILNFAREFVVNEDDIAEALESGKVARYVCDFPGTKTVKMKNTVVIPHLGASTEEAEDNCAKLAVEELQDYLDNGNILHSANFPDVNAGVCKTAARLAFLHRNVPNMLGQLTAIVGEAGCNIENMQNASKGQYAYTIMDFGSKPDAEIVSRLKQVEGMLRVRIVK